MALPGNTNGERIWNYFKTNGMPDYGIAGLIGNLDAESGLDPKNLEDSYERRLGYTNESYVIAVDSGAYGNFVHDGAGFGLAQHTWYARKQELLSFAKQRGCSIGDLEMQCAFILKELSEKYKSVYATLMNAKSVREASNAVLLKYECPLDQSVSMQDRRADISQKYYTRYAANHVEEVVDVGYYQLLKGAREKLSDNFLSNEFDCHGSGCCSKTIINEKLVKYLQQIRDHFKSPITITSAYRCQVHNRNVGGATGSRHTAGDAADIVVAGHTPMEVAKYAESIGILGIGLYETNADGHFVHIDTRDKKSFWYGQAQAYRSTFGGASAGSSNGNSSNAGGKSSPDLIVYGQSGSAVKELQQTLIKLGYSCGASGADGSFGLNTMNAVKKFQKDIGFSEKEQDGVVGPDTKAALQKALREKEGAKTYVVTATLLNIRSGAGTNNNVVGTLPKGTEISVSEEENGWGKIDTGWVSLQYCQRKG